MKKNKAENQDAVALTDGNGNRELTQEELESAAGGIVFQIKCRMCGKQCIAPRPGIYLCTSCASKMEITSEDQKKITSWLP